MLRNGPKKKHKPTVMKTLSQAIAEFDPVSATEESIKDQFRSIAEAVFNSGYFLVNGKRRIYPIDIEFYFYAEYDTTEKWRRDFNMYHKGKDVPYFPKEGSLYPHRSGVDYTFENPKKHYRASFLIRAYEVGLNGRKEDHPTYLWEDMFGECRCDGKGLNVIWKNEQHPKQWGADKAIRHNLNKRDGKQDTNEWRFKRVEK